MGITLGERIRQLREEEKFSLRELSKKAGGLSAAFLSDIELNRRFPSEEALTRIAGALRANVEELKQYDTRPPVEEMKRRSAHNPELGVAFRKIVELPTEDLLKFVAQIEKKKE